LGSPNGRNRVWGFPLLATHQKAASPLPASGTHVPEAPVCIIQCPLRQIRVHHLNQYLRFATRCGEGIRPLHPAREASRPPGPARGRNRKGWPPSPLSRLGPLQTDCRSPPRHSASGYGGIVSITSFLQKQAIAKIGGMDPIRKKEPCATQVPFTAITRCLRCCLHCHPHAGLPRRKTAGHVSPARRAAVRPAGEVRPGINHSRLYPVHSSDATLFYQFTVYSYLIVTDGTKGSHITLFIILRSYN
jgi:hypothetical protein